MSEVDAPSTGDRGTLVPFTPMRNAIARRMVESKRVAPHFYVETEASMDAALALIRQRNAEQSAPDVTVTAVLAKACATALRAHPQLNSVWTERGLERIDEVNLGVAVALDDGLIAPALLGVESLSLGATAEALGDLIARARARKLRPQEVSDGTFTLSNLGSFDVSRFTAIVVPPQVAILATGRTSERPVVVDGEVVVRSVLAATVSADHRAVDGAEVAAFLETFKTLLANPAGLDG